MCSSCVVFLNDVSVAGVSFILMKGGVGGGLDKYRAAHFLEYETTFELFRKIIVLG